MSRRSCRSRSAEMIDGILVFITGPVLGATLCPGMFLCVPGLILFGAAIVVPIVVVAALALLLGAIAAMPYPLVRSAVRLLRRPGARYRGGSPRPRGC
jgi:hypothetical protein